MKNLFNCFTFIFLTITCITAAEPETKTSLARPNVLWISLEDISPDLGCYGDKYAATPVIDKLASQGVRFTRAFTHAGVCAPSRSGIITGMYPPSITTQHMRCQGVPPAHVRCFTEYLREAGYYCTNNSKTDYQFEPPITAWDENGNKAHWRGRAKGQPFFAVMNLTSTHESQIRNGKAAFEKIAAALPPEQRHDPAKAVLPPYYPDTPVVRHDWASYYNNISWTEKRIDAILKELEADGLAEDTIVWFWGDHGRGLPRAKRWLYDSGTHIPLIVRVPEKWRKLASPANPDAVKPGTVNSDLVAAVDFAPTMLSLCGIEIPQHLQGQAFLGKDKASTPRKFVYGHRDRMDERYDLIRMVRDTRYKYIRNFMPHLPYAQNIGYMNEMPTMQEWRRLHAEGKLVGPQKIFFEPIKPLEELYDTEADPHEVVNLADKPEHAERLKAMRAECYRWMGEINDTGLIPESMLEVINHPEGEKRIAPKPAIQVFVKPADQQSAKLLVSVPVDGAVAYRLVNQTQQNKTTPWLANMGNELINVRDGEIMECMSVRIGYQSSDKISWKLGDPPIKATVFFPDSVFKERAELAKQMIKLATSADQELLEYRVGHTLIEDAKHYRALSAKFMGSTLGGPGVWSPKVELNSDLVIALLWAQNWHEYYAAQVPILFPKNKTERVTTRFAQNVIELNDLRRLAQYSENHKAVAEVAAKTLADAKNKFIRLGAAQILDDLGESARPVLDTIKANTDVKANEYVGRICTHIVNKLEPATKKKSAGD